MNVIDLAKQAGLWVQNEGQWMAYGNDHHLVRFARYVRETPPELPIPSPQGYQVPKSYKPFSSYENVDIKDYAINQWWFYELERHWGIGAYSDDTRRAAKTALDLLHTLLKPVQYYRCGSCHTCERRTTPCWKCGTECTKVTEDWPPHEEPDLDKLRAAAKTKGYALGVHGSRENDLDVIAVPWIDEAVSPQELIEHLAKAMETENGPCRIIGPESKPLGRISYNIQLNGWFKLIDISITPKGGS